MLIHIPLNNHQLVSGRILDINLSYQLFGLPLHTAPLVLVNHALTGNSQVSGSRGWWRSLVGPGKAIDTELVTVICFNIPGNGNDGFQLEQTADFITEDIARIFLKGLQQLDVSRLQLLVGGSLGGCIGWQMLALSPHLTQHFVPVACDYETSDWLHAQCTVQDFLLAQEDQPLEKARYHAMLTYRTPESLNTRFQGVWEAEEKRLKSDSWLCYHGRELASRYTLNSYRLMNRLLKTVRTPTSHLVKIEARIHFIAITSDQFFPAWKMKKTFQLLQAQQRQGSYHEINSIHGHDAFLMEYQQLNDILSLII